MMAIFGNAPKASSVESSATGNPRSATTGASTSGAIPVHDQSHANGEATFEDNPLDRYSTPRPDPPTKVKIRRGDEWICLQHGPMCSPGICTARARVDRDERWKSAKDGRRMSENGWRGRRGRREREMKLARAEGRELPHHDQLTYLVNVPRGPSNKSETKGNADGSHDQGAILIQQLHKR